jgi:hypothetical protein
MKRMAGFVTVGLAGLALLQGYALGAERQYRVPAGLPPSAGLLLRYDANHDGVITREELEAGIKADFEAADVNHDGCLKPAEVRAENERRIARDGAQAAPVVDWNLDGCVDLKEFGTAYRSYFELADRAKNGRVTLLELRGPSMPIPPPPTAKDSGGKEPDKNAGASAVSGAAGSANPGGGY